VLPSLLAAIRRAALRESPSQPDVSAATQGKALAASAIMAKESRVRGLTVQNIGFV
jgi:hypothetical protein